MEGKRRSGNRGWCGVVWGYIVFLTALELKQELWGLVIGGGGLYAAGASRGAQCGLDAAAGVYDDVYRRPFTNPTASSLQVLSNVSHLSGTRIMVNGDRFYRRLGNVPSTILLLNYVPPSLLLAWAVNVGGFGLSPGSLGKFDCVTDGERSPYLVAFSSLFDTDAVVGGAGGICLLVMIPAG